MPADDGRKKPHVQPGLHVTERVVARQSVARDVRRPDTHRPIPEVFEDEEGTGKYTGAELQEIRSRRPTDKRLERLEQFKDEVIERLGGVEVQVAEMKGELKILPSLIETMQSATAAMQQREHVTFTAKVDVDKAQALDTVAARGDERKAKLTKLEWGTKAFAIVSSIVAIVATLVAAGRC